jgi:hypothetical protein
MYDSASIFLYIFKTIYWRLILSIKLLLNTIPFKEINPKLTISTMENLTTSQPPSINNNVDSN